MATVRLGKRTEGRSPMIKDFVPLAGLNDLAFGTWDIFEENCYEAADHAGVLEKSLLDQLRAPLSAIRPMPAVFDQSYVRRLHGPNVKPQGSKMDHAEMVIEDIQQFREKTGAARLSMIWCGSTEVFHKAAAVHQSLRDFECGLQKNDPEISPSQIYAYAALKSGVPYANGAPHLTTDTPALMELARERQVPISGKDFKTGQTFMKTLIAPGLKSRMLGLAGWFSTNILGNRDGEVLDDPGSFQSKEESKLSSLEHILQAGALSRPVQAFQPQGAHRVLPAPWRRQRGLGQHRHLRVARLPHADQDQLPVSRLDPGGASGARPGAVHGLGTTRRDARCAGVAVVLFQGSDDGSQPQARA